MTIHLSSTGGLGNQLFQIAALLDTSQRLNTKPHISFKSTGPTIRTFDSQPLADVLSIDSCSIFCRFTPKFKYTEKYLSYEDRFRTIKKNTTISGYFQDHQYHLISINSILESVISLGQKCCISTKEIHPQALAIHIRRGDYMQNLSSFETHGLLQSKYFIDSISHIMKNKMVKIINIFSDNELESMDMIENVMRNLSLDLNVNYFKCLKSNLFCELYLLAMHNYLILSNSSFSWWAARLINREITVGPKFWYKDIGMQNINPMMSDWITVDNDFQKYFEF